MQFVFPLKEKKILYIHGSLCCVYKVLGLIFRIANERELTESRKKIAKLEEEFADVVTDLNKKEQELFTTCQEKVSYIVVLQIFRSCRAVLSSISISLNSFFMKYVIVFSFSHLLTALPGSSPFTVSLQVLGFEINQVFLELCVNLVMICSVSVPGII